MRISSSKNNIRDRTKIYFIAKGVLYVYDIIIILSRHVETVVLLSNKNADTHINVNVEFGEGDGKILV